MHLMNAYNYDYFTHSVFSQQSFPPKINITSVCSLLCAISLSVILYNKAYLQSIYKH